MQTPASDGETVLTLPDVLDLKAAAPLHRQILAERGRDLALDASEVRRLGGQCLQIILAAMFAWAADGKVLSFARPSGAFVQALDVFGFRYDDGVQKEPHP